MKVKVYYNGKPCVQEVATAIARELKLNCDPLPPSYMPEGLLCAFIGSSDKGGKATKDVLDFISIVDEKRIGAAVLYATSSGDGSRVIESMRAACVARNIPIYAETLVCSGKGTFGGKMPTEEELKKAGEFARKATETYLDKHE